MDMYRVAVIESMMTAKIAKIMEEFHECEEGPARTDFIEETVEELKNLNVSRSLSPVATGGAKREWDPETGADLGTRQLTPAEIEQYSTIKCNTIHGYHLRRLRRAV